MVSRILLFPATLLIAGLAGCASVPADWGRGDAARMAAEHGRPVPAPPDVKAYTDQALATPLTADTAVRLALINNPAMRRETARLGFAAAEVYDAGRLANPVFSGTRLFPVVNPAGQSAQFTLGLAFNFVNLLFLPANRRYATAEFESAKLAVASSALDLAAEVESAWFEAVGADQLAAMREAADKAQRASADLSQRFFDAGNISRRELAMEQAAASQASLAAIFTRAKSVEAYAKLNRLMGLSADQGNWVLDAKLAEPLPQEDALSDLQKLAIDSRLDVASLRRNAEAVAGRYGLARQTRLINGIEVGVQRERDYDGAINVGPTLSLELPLFNWGGGRVAAAHALLDQTEADLDARVLDVSNGVALAAAKVGATKASAELYRTALVPQREEIVAQAQKEQNYMLIGVFDVILAKQQQFDAFAGYIEAVRDYWVARTELARAVGRTLPSSTQAASPAIDPSQLVAPPAAPAGHSHSSMPSMPGMDMSDMRGMSHGDTAPTPASPPTGGHAGHSAAPAGGQGHQAMPDMPGMEHSQHEPDHTAHSMPDMPGMDHGEAATPSDDAARRACANAQSSTDLVVRQAITEQCKDLTGSHSRSGGSTPGPSDSEHAHDH